MELTVRPPRIRFSFDPQKGLIILEYLLKSVGGMYNYMALLKLAFFADRYHVRTYARPVSGDTYFAMKLGAVPSNLSDIIDVQDFISQSIQKVDQYTMGLKTDEINMDVLSKSDIEALKFSIVHFSGIGKSKPYAIAELTHAYPEWDKYRTRFANNPYGREDMLYEDFIVNANPDHPEFLRFHFKDPFPILSPQEQDDLREEMIERTILFA